METGHYWPGVLQHNYMYLRIALWQYIDFLSVPLTRVSKIHIVAKLWLDAQFGERYPKKLFVLKSRVIRCGYVPKCCDKSPFNWLFENPRNSKLVQCLMLSGTKP
jgi:hypothetical protein